MAHELVRVGKLTKYQAAAIYQEKLDALVLGNYVIIDKLGAGGMGQVFRARHRKMDRVVALKLLPKKALSSPDAVERFHREVKAAARLVHSHIVTALDADAGGGTHFLVMEYIEGHDLSALVKKEGPLPVSKAVTYTLQAARGLEHAHAENVIHRDVKPSNLLVDKRGTVKILDMGLARFSDLPDSANVVDTSGANQLTQAGNIMGTVDYMAPEQAVDTRQADERADIYSLGCALCYLLTGRPPFEGDTMMARLVAHRDAPIPSLRKLRPDVPAALESLFQHMLAKRPEDRPQTMTEIIATLETIAGTRAAATRTWRLPWILAGGCAAAAALVAVATLA
ncbi:MAG TPA: serine/threonine-protein kinase, partial [Pirellulales bacterium]